MLHLLCLPLRSLLRIKAQATRVTRAARRVFLETFDRLLVETAWTRLEVIGNEENGKGGLPQD
jgi:hypothetical protein